MESRYSQLLSTDFRTSWPATHLTFLQDNGYLDSNGKVNFNDRISAILNGTTHEGNWLYTVAEAARKVGLFPETMLPSDENLSWNEYYDKSKITSEMLAVGKKFLEYFELPYEWVNISRAELIKHLKHAPLQVVIPGHAVEDFKQDGDTTNYFDTYNPFLKTTNRSNLSSAMKIIINPKELMNPNIVIYKKGDEYQVGIRMTSQEGFAQKLVETGCYDLIGPDGNPDFTKIDQITHVL